MGVGHTCGLFYLLVGGVLHTEGYVGTYGVVEQDSLLVDVAHEAAEVACAEVPHILAAHFHTSFLGVVETGQQVYESTLARAALSHEGDSLSRHDVKAYIFKYPVRVIVAEVHVLESEHGLSRGGGLRHGVRFLRVADRILCLQYLVYPLHGGHTFLNGVSGFAQLLGRIDDGVEDDHVVNEVRGGDAAGAGENEGASEPQYNSYGCGAEEFAHGVCQGITALY